MSTGWFATATSVCDFSWVMLLAGKHLGGEKSRCSRDEGRRQQMMGSKERSLAPLIKVSLEHLVPQDHFSRHLERSLDLSFVREFVPETYARGDRPSITPLGFSNLQLVTFFT